MIHIIVNSLNEQLVRMNWSAQDENKPSCYLAFSLHIIHLSSGVGACSEPSALSKNWTFMKPRLVHSKEITFVWSELNKHEKLWRSVINTLNVGLEHGLQKIKVEWEQLLVGEIQRQAGVFNKVWSAPSADPGISLIFNSYYRFLISLIHIVRLLWLNLFIPKASTE